MIVSTEPITVDINTLWLCKTWVSVLMINRDFRTTFLLSVLTSIEVNKCFERGIKISQQGLQGQIIQASVCAVS